MSRSAHHINVRKKIVAFFLEKTVFNNFLPETQAVFKRGGGGGVCGRFKTSL